MKHRKECVDSPICEKKKMKIKTIEMRGWDTFPAALYDVHGGVRVCEEMTNVVLRGLNDLLHCK